MVVRSGKAAGPGRLTEALLSETETADQTAVELCWVDTKLAQDGPQRAGRKITTTVSRDDGELLIGRVPPDFV